MKKNKPKILKDFLNFSSVFTLAALLIVMCGCSALQETFNFTSIDDDKVEDLELPAKKLLEEGMEDYSVGKYFTAIEFFEEIIEKYPFSREATLAELKAADCSFYLSKYDEAFLLYKEFENRHPTNEGIPYVMFQKAMCYYKQIERVDRDTTGAIESIKFFKQLLKAFPDSPYNSEAKARIAAATEFLANHEYFVVEYYMRSDKYAQAKVRIKYLLATYPDTDVAAKAAELLADLNKENYTKDLDSWFPKFSLPDWRIFGDKKDKDTTETKK